MREASHHPKIKEVPDGVDRLRGGWAAGDPLGLRSEARVIPWDSRYILAKVIEAHRPPEQAETPGKISQLGVD